MTDGEPDIVPTFTDAKKQKIFEKYGGRCAYCGCALSIKKMTVDHIIPKAGSGGDGINNLNPSCKPCNTLKGQMTLGEFKTHVDELIANGKYKFTYPSGKAKKTKFYFLYFTESAVKTKAKQPEPAITNMNNVIRIPVSLYKKLETDAKREGVTVEQYAVYKLSI